ncbi:hypothetical protein J6590_075609 [Homalodisca vitripennis]|nr:hypothetical protein J6590_075609 [Homalodisca vitripennis]
MSTCLYKDLHPYPSTRPLITCDLVHLRRRSVLLKLGCCVTGFDFSCRCLFGRRVWILCKRQKVAVTTDLDPGLTDWERKSGLALALPRPLVALPLVVTLPSPFGTFPPRALCSGLWLHLLHENPRSDEKFYWPESFTKLNLYIILL